MALNRENEQSQLKNHAEEDYNYSTSDIDAIERGEISVEDAKTIRYLETYQGFLPDEIRTIIRGRDQYKEVLRSNLGYPRYYSKEPQDWRLKEILLFTLEGIRAVKVEEKISKVMQDSIKGLSGLNREDWMDIAEDIRAQGTTTHKLSRLVQPLNKAEILRREFIRELPLVFYDRVRVQNKVKAETILSTIKSFEPVNLFGPKFDLDPEFDTRFLSLSYAQLEREFGPEGRFKTSPWGYPLIAGFYAELRRNQ